MLDNLFLNIYIIKNQENLTTAWMLDQTSFMSYTTSACNGMLEVCNIKWQVYATTKKKLKNKLD